MIARIKAGALEKGRSLLDWMEERTGVVSITEKLLYEPTPKRGRWLYTLGSATLFLITLQFLTGILLLFYYVPTTDNAWDSIYYIMNSVYFGQLIRGIHFWSANALILVIGLRHDRPGDFQQGVRNPRVAPAGGPRSSHRCSPVPAAQAWGVWRPVRVLRASNGVAGPAADGGVFQVGGR
jgi:hypothetical protein